MAARTSLDAEVAEALRKGAELFNAGLFWECHEVLEEVWLKDHPPRKTFLQGIIKVAAGYHHYQQGNWTGMVHLLSAGGDLLEPFAPSYRGLALGEFLRGVRADGKLAAALLKGNAKASDAVIPALAWSPGAPLARAGSADSYDTR